MNNFDKAKKNLKNDMLILFILELLIVSFSLYKGNTNYFSIGFTILLLLGYFLAKNGSKAAGIIGVIVGILMAIAILNGDLVDALLGIFILFHSSKYLKLFEN